MSQSQTRRQKRTDHNRADSTRDIELIDEQTIRRLEDETTDEPGCRFAAVARSLEHKRAPNTQFSLPCTRVAYVDESGRYAIEREFFGHRPNWHEIPRTVVVTDDQMVRELPSEHAARYDSILSVYHRVLASEE